MPPPPSLAAFGQELYADHAARTLRLALETPTRAELHWKVVAALPQPSAETRARIADKLIQRLIPIARGQVIVSPFVRLAACIPDAQARRELIYYRTAQTDVLVAALAAEIFYPCFVQGRPPKGFSAAQFRMANTGALFDYDTVITRPFVSTYARKLWNFRSEASITRALRILREAGLIESLPPAHRGARYPCFVVTAHTVRLATLIFCLYEHLGGRRGPGLTLDQIQSADFARVFILRPVDITTALEQARRQRLLVRIGGTIVRYAPAVELDALVDMLLGRGGARAQGPGSPA